ncbi:PREDICTED: zinc finger [Prunus dulcis]|uniref:PREDICTED: zinc finger n=1 Tax=Prunus dulcis TaxID=3755 RepID=A0A5E4EGM2_PRUDU|nr:zinc finger protein CONSTANS-LIKE 13 [Prunus dulcis]VVA14110.1 PREDICTED: zinc finger [Prunus dulcis]
MNGSSRNEEAEAPQPEREHQKRLCDYCGSSMALLYCRADSAKLCFLCDREVHSANQLFSKHTRSLLCDACDGFPASIFCTTESSVLCQNCDWESHNLSSSSVHDRRPLEGFSGCPCLNELLTVVGFENMDKKALLLSDESGGGGGGGDRFLGCGVDGSFDLDDGFSDFLVWDTPSVVSLDDLIVSNPAYKFQAMGVPPLPKNRNAACGRHKEEIFRQLRVLVKSEPNLFSENVDVKPLESLASEQNMQRGSLFTGFEHDAEPTVFPAYEAHDFQYNDCGAAEKRESSPKTFIRTYLQECCVVPDKHSYNDGSASHANDGHGHGGQMNSEASSAFPKVAAHELSSQNRETALSRYKEKKKTRRYEKHIRYESRKVRAESRTRIKGRFAKMDH